MQQFPQTQMKIPLHDYQIFCKEFIKNRPFSGLFLKMGLGKTSIILETLYELNPGCHVLIIAPKTVAKCTWINEIKKWDMPFRTKSLIVNDKGKQLSAKKREELYQEIPKMPPTVFFVNQDIISKLVKRFPKQNWPFKVVIIDESQAFKSYSASRFKSLKEVRPWIYRLHIATGSPQPKGPMDLWSQIYLLDQGYRLGQNITQYRETFFNPGIIVNNYPVTWNPKPGAENEIYRRISDLVVSMRNTLLKLPPLQIEDIIIPMDPETTKKYKNFAKEYVLETCDGTTIDAANAAVLQNKLSQMASGAIYTDAKTHTFEKIHEEKLEICRYLVEDTDDNVLIAYYFQSDCNMLLDYFKRKTDIDLKVFDGSPKMEQEWNQGKYKAMLLQPNANGRGVNLQEGSATLIWYTLPWSLESYEQTNARLYRQGQKRQTTIYHLMMDHTVDTKILKSLQKKDISQEALITAVETTIDEIRNQKI